MKPIAFACAATLPMTAERIVEQILDLTNWPQFHGYGPIPGIKTAEFEVRTPGLVGTRIRVVNLDGSSHVEEIVDWQPGQRLKLKMHDFSRPLSRWASHFEETWEFEPAPEGTKVVRSFQLHARSIFGGLLLRAVSFFLKRAIARHLHEMR